MRKRVLNYEQHVVAKLLVKRNPTKRMLIKFLADLCKAIDMKPLHKPHLHYGDSASQVGPGWTALQGIETSHIAIHCFNRTGIIDFDLYSCKYFKARDVRNYLIDYFNPHKIIFKAVPREALEFRL